MLIPLVSFHLHIDPGRQLESGRLPVITKLQVRNLRVREVKILIQAYTAGHERFQTLKQVYQNSKSGFLVFSLPGIIILNECQPRWLQVSYIGYQIALHCWVRRMPRFPDEEALSQKCQVIGKHDLEWIQTQVGLTPKSTCFPMIHNASVKRLPSI